MSKSRYGTPAVIKVRREVRLPIRIMETWQCTNAHEFGFDPDHAPTGYLPTQCCKPGCNGRVSRIKAAGVVR